jgi:hypothetical protein
VQEYKPITNAALLILTAGNSLEITSDLSARLISKIQKGNGNRDLMRYSSKLAMVWSGEDVASIYRTLGLKSL